ncbi:MAG: 30S ribosomal protein S20 [Wigglesworthia glossinidia]|nr:30S ribosomal protein S20 [Wigglesworthia glossinidia]
MSNTKSAKKRVVQSEKNRRKNSSQKSMIRTFIKKVYIAILNKNEESAINAFKSMQSNIDKCSQKGLIHKNTGSRYKSKLSKKIKFISTKSN